jgi:hypothetical protein
MVYPLTTLLLRNKTRKQSSDRFYKMNNHWRDYAKYKKSVINKMLPIALFHLCKVSMTGKYREIKKRRRLREFEG